MPEWPPAICGPGELDKFQKSPPVLRYLREHPDQRVTAIEIEAAIGMSRARVDRVVHDCLTKRGGPARAWGPVYRIEPGVFEYRTGKARVIPKRGKSMDRPNGAVAVRRAQLPVNQTAVTLDYLRGRPNEQVRFTEVVQGTGLDAGRVANILSRQLKKASPADTDWLCVHRVELGFYEFRPDHPRDGAQTRVFQRRDGRAVYRAAPTKTQVVMHYLREHAGQEVSAAEVEDATGVDAARVSTIVSGFLANPAGARGDWRCVYRVGRGEFVFRPDEPRPEGTEREPRENEAVRSRSVKWDPIVRNAETGEWLLRSPDQQLWVARPATVFERE